MYNTGTLVRFDNGVKAKVVWVSGPDDPEWYVLQTTFVPDSMTDRIHLRFAWAPESIVRETLPILGFKVEDYVNPTVVQTDRMFRGTADASKLLADLVKVSREQNGNAVTEPATMV